MSVTAVITHAAKTAAKDAPAPRIYSASGNYVALPGVWSRGECYRISTKWAANSPRHNCGIVDVITAEGAQEILDALDAKDAIAGVQAELDAARRDYADLAYAVDNTLWARFTARVYRFLDRMER